MLSFSNVKIGDTARFPIGRLGSDDVYRHRFEVVAFRPDGLIVLRRMADRLERTVSAHWYERYRTDESWRPKRYSVDDERARALAAMRARRLASIKLQDDPSVPGFYVSAIDRARKSYAFLLGPFRSHYDALIMVNTGRYLAREYDRFGEYAYGTCQSSTSRTIGKFNHSAFPIGA